MSKRTTGPRPAPPNSTQSNLSPSLPPTIPPSRRQERGGEAVPSPEGGLFMVEKENDEQDTAERFRDQLRLEGLDEELDPSTRYDYLESTISSLQSQLSRKQTQLSLAQNLLSQKETDNLDLTEREWVWKEKLRKCEDEKREGERVRVCLEKELEYFRSQPSQLRTSSSTSALVKKSSAVALQGSPRPSRSIDGLSSFQSSSSSLGSPLAVRRSASVAPLRINRQQSTPSFPPPSPLGPSRSSNASASNPRATVPRTTTSLVTQRSRVPLQPQLLAQSGGSTTPTQPPPSSMIKARRGGADENDVVVGGEARRALEAARGEKERGTDGGDACSRVGRGGEVTGGK